MDTIPPIGNVTFCDILGIFPVNFPPYTKHNILEKPLATFWCEQGKVKGQISGNKTGMKIHRL